MRVFGREPALIIAAIAGALNLGVTFKLGISSEQAGAIVAVITAAAGVLTAMATRPIAPAVFKTLVTASAALLSAFGFNLTPEQTGAVTTLVLMVLAMLTRAQVTPASDPRGTDVPTTADPITEAPATLYGSRVADLPRRDVRP